MGYNMGTYWLIVSLNTGKVSGCGMAVSWLAVLLMLTLGSSCQGLRRPTYSRLSVVSLGRQASGRSTSRRGPWSTSPKGR
eukprot:3665039-Pyramimonas_sp.AAC.1